MTNSVYQAMIDREVDVYWKNASVFDTINTYINCNFEGLKLHSTGLLQCRSGITIRQGICRHGIHSERRCRVPTLLIEQKWDKSADSAIRQIKDRRYVGSLRGYGEKVLLVGINYDKDSKDKRHECVIEEWYEE